MKRLLALVLAAALVGLVALTHYIVRDVPEWACAAVRPFTGGTCAPLNNLSFWYYTFLMEKDCQVVERTESIKELADGSKFPVTRVKLRASAPCMALFTKEDTQRWSFFQDGITWWNTAYRDYTGVIDLTFATSWGLFKG